MNPFLVAVLEALGWTRNADRWGKANLYLHHHTLVGSDVWLDETEAARLALEELEEIARWFGAYHEELRNAGRALSERELAAIELRSVRRKDEEIRALRRELTREQSDREADMLLQIKRLELELHSSNSKLGHHKHMVAARDERIAKLEGMLAMRCAHGSTGHASKCEACVKEWMTELSRIAGKGAKSP